MASFFNEARTIQKWGACMFSQLLRPSYMVRVCVVLSVAYGPSALQGQQRTGSDLNGMCVASVDGINGMTSAIFSTPARFRGNAERAWAAYAVQQNAGKPIKGSRCLWSTTAIDPAKVNITNQNGGKVTQTGWKYDAPLSTQTAQVAAQSTAPTAASSTASQLSPSSSSASAVTTSTNAAGASTTTAGSTPATGVASMGQTMQQSMQDAKNTASTAVTGTVNVVTTTTVQAVTGGIQNMQASLINRLSRKKQTPTAPPTTATGGPPALQSGPDGGSQNMLTTGTVPSTAPGVAAANVSGKPVASIAQASSGGLSFTFCHLAASGKEYISDIFPTLTSDQNTLGAAFWQAMGAQYHLLNIPYRNNVACVHSATEAEATAAMQALKSTGLQRGVQAGQEMDTGWTHSSN